MAAEITHIIKRGDVAARRAKRPEPSLLYGALKVPKEHVRVTSASQREESGYALDRLVDRETISVETTPVEIATREIEVKVPPKQTEPDDPEPEADAEPTIEEIEARWRARLDEEVERTRATAFEEGKSAAMAAVQDELDQALKRFAQDAAALQDAWKEHVKDSGLHLVRLAIRISRTVLDAPLPDGVRRVTETAIADALDGMADDAAIEVVLHPVSYLRLQEAGLEEQLNAVKSRIRWRSNPDLKENEWIVESDRSAIRRLESELLDQLQRELSLRDHGDHLDDR